MERKQNGEGSSFEYDKKDFVDKTNLSLWLVEIIRKIFIDQKICRNYCV